MWSAGSFGSVVLSDLPLSNSCKSLAMPGNELGPWVQRSIARQADLLTRWRKELQKLRGHLIVRYEQAEVVVEGDKVAVEQPMGCR